MTVQERKKLIDKITGQLKKLNRQDLEKVDKFLATEEERQTENK